MSIETRTPPAGEEATSEIIASQSLTPPDRLDTQSGIETQRYSLISRNPIVKTALDLCEKAAFWTTASVKPNPKNNYNENPEFEQLDEEIVALLTQQIEHVGEDDTFPPSIQRTPTFDSAIKSLTRKARVYGFSIAEMVFEPDNGQNVLKKLKPKPSWNFDFYEDEYDEIETVIYNQRVKVLEPERFVVATWPRLEDGNYYGVSDLQCIEDDIAELEAMEKRLRRGIGWNSYRPLVVHYVNQKLSKKEIEESKNVLAGLSGSVTAKFPMVMDANMTPIKAFNFEMLDDRASQYVLEQGWKTILEIIKRVNRALGIPDELGNVSVNVGSNAKARTQFDLFIAVVESIQQFAQTIANRVLHTIIYYNYNNLPNKYHRPIWAFDALEDEYEVDKANYYKSLVESLIVSPDEPFIRERLDLPAATAEKNVEDTLIQDNYVKSNKSKWSIFK
jgi:hypothetical protein